MARPDLIALTDEGLIQLSNAGLVKRAVRELAAGTGPAIAETAEGVIEARFVDGTLTRLAPGQGLANASCTCPSSGVCRHRIMLAVAYRAERAEAAGGTTPDREAWSPASLDPEVFEATLAPSTRAELTRLLASRHTIRLDYGQTPTAHLPMASVRFLVPGDLSYARCDCAQGQHCAHVALAIRGFHAAAGGRETTLGGGDAAADGGDRERLRAACDAVITRLVEAGIVAGPAAYEQPLAAALRHAHDCGAAQILLVLGALSEQVEAYEARSARYDERAVLRLAAELFARTRAGDAAIALGIGEPFETAMGKSRLVSLGARLRQEGADIRASVLLADSDMGATMLIEKLFSPLPAEKHAFHATVRRRQMAPGLPVAGVGRGQILTSVARRRADGLLSLGSGSGGRTQVMPRDAAFSFPAPLAAASLTPIATALRSRPISLLRPRRLCDTVHIFDIDAVLGQSWAPGRQIWEGAVRLCNDGGTLHLEREFDAAAPGATGILAAALSGSWGPVRHVAGPVRMEGGALVCTPWSLSADRFIVPDLDADDDSTHAVTPALRDMPNDLLEETEILLGGVLHGGMRAQNAAGTTGTTLATRLDNAGYRAMAERLAGWISTSAPDIITPFCNAAIWLLTLHESREAAAPLAMDADRDPPA